MLLTIMTRLILFACILISYSFAIDLDYYAEDESTVDNDKTTPESRRVGDDTRIITTIEDISAVVTKIDNRDCVTHSKNILQGIDNTSRVETSNKSTTKGFPVGMFEEYEYMYDDKMNNCCQPVLRHEENNKTGTFGLKIPMQNDSENLRYTDYFNLSPALESIKLKESMTSKSVKSVWYVPENYPCWNLPFIYGKLGQRPQTSNVFVIYSGDLSVEHEPQEDKEEVSGDTSYSASNLWCEQEPCYGDHTLCLFPDDKISEICENYYHVKSPNILEQTALVNTINSMRNRVAMGTADVYSHLPTASNMEQIIYDYDLARMANRWLRQCLPGPAACSSLRNDLITQLECTKSAKECCLFFNPTETEPKW